MTLATVLSDGNKLLCSSRPALDPSLIGRPGATPTTDAHRPEAPKPAPWHSPWAPLLQVRRETRNSRVVAQAPTTPSTRHEQRLCHPRTLCRMEVYIIDEVPRPACTGRPVAISTGLACPPAVGRHLLPGWLALPPPSAPKLANQLPSRIPAMAGSVHLGGRGPIPTLAAPLGTKTLASPRSSRAGRLPACPMPAAARAGQAVSCGKPVWLLPGSRGIARAAAFRWRCRPQSRKNRSARRLQANHAAPQCGEASPPTSPAGRGKARRPAPAQRHDHGFVPSSPVQRHHLQQRPHPSPSLQATTLAVLLAAARPWRTVLPHQTTQTGLLRKPAGPNAGITTCCTPGRPTGSVAASLDATMLNRRYGRGTCPGLLWPAAGPGQ